MSGIGIIDRFLLTVRLAGVGIGKSIRKRLSKGNHGRTRRTLVLSYPKSGRTWLRTMLDDLGVRARYDHAEANALYSAEKAFVPDTVDPSDIPERKVVLLLRDPRDILVSSYFEATKRQRVFSGTLSAFIRHPEFGIEPLLRFQGKWKRAAEQSDRFLVARYEELLHDGVGTLGRIVSFVDQRHIPAQRIESTLKAFSFDRMKSMEKAGLLRVFYGKKLKAADPGDTDSYKVRRGGAGGYATYFSAEDTKYCRTWMKKLDSWYA